MRSVRDCQLSRLSTCPVDIMQRLLAGGRSGISTRAVSGSTVLHLFAGRMSARWRATQSRARRWRFDSTLLVPAAGNWPIAGEALQQMHASDPEDLVVKLRYAVDDCCARSTGHLRPRGILVIGGYRRRVCSVDFVYAQVLRCCEHSEGIWMLEDAIKLSPSTTLQGERLLFNLCERPTLL